MSRAKQKIATGLSAQGLRFAIVVSRYNADLTTRLLAGAEKILKGRGAKVLQTFSVPGAYEIPITCLWLAQRKKFDAIVALGAVIRGETTHYDYVAGECARGLIDVMRQTQVPISFGVLTTENVQQAKARVGGRHGHKGEEAALVAIEMARLYKDIRKL